ncbi:N-acetyltransferase family protein [Leifsonia sp. A12D58]|uniref:GNAT family N-acetyltransferase n=1 Tax=Leifsonia sp. A12D58 TaxID=3397674 RepID=UPI0039DFA2E3
MSADKPAFAPVSVPVSVRAAGPADYAEWAELFRRYREFYALVPDESVIERVWGWIIDETAEVHAFVAAVDGKLVGLAHYRRFARPSTGSIGIFLDDLYTSPSSRGAGVGRELLRELSVLAAVEGRSVVRWITAEDNTRARRLYDSAATQTKWVTYDLAPGSL